MSGNDIGNTSSTSESLYTAAEAANLPDAKTYSMDESTSANTLVETEKPTLKKHANNLTAKTSGILWGKDKHVHTEGKDEKNTYVGKAKIQADATYKVDDTISIKGSATNRTKISGTLDQDTNNKVNTYSSDAKITVDVKNDGITYKAGVGHDNVTGESYPVASIKGDLGTVSVNDNGPHTPPSSKALFKNGKAGDAMQGTKSSTGKFSEFTEVNPNGVVKAELNKQPIGDSGATVKATATYNTNNDQIDTAITVEKSLGDSDKLIVDVGLNGSSDTFFAAASVKDNDSTTTAYAEQVNGGGESIYGVAHKQTHSGGLSTETGAYYSEGATGKPNKFGVKETVSIGSMKDGQVQIGIGVSQQEGGPASVAVSAGYYKKF